MSETLRWTCPTCKDSVGTRFCGRCGEEPLPARDLTFRGLAEKLVHALTSIDARAMRTLRRLLLSPGELTVAWTTGVRKPYVPPFQLFLIANVIFFAIQSLTGETVFSSALDSHLHHQDWSEFARSLVDRRLAAKHIDLEAYAPIFDRAVVLNAKSFIVLMTIPFALLLPLVFIRKHRPFMAHLAFSLHLYTFLLLLFCASLIAARFSALLGFGGLDSAVVDNSLTGANLVACSVYSYLAIARVYQTSGALRLVQALLVSVSVAAIVVAYRFVLFLLTLYATT